MSTAAREHWQAIIVGDLPEVFCQALAEHGFHLRRVHRPLAALTILAEEGAQLVVFGRCDEPLDLRLCAQLRAEPSFSRVALALVCEDLPPAIPDVDAVFLADTVTPDILERGLQACIARIHGDSAGRPFLLLLQQLRRRDPQRSEQLESLSSRLAELDRIVQERTRELATSEHTYRGLVDNNPDAAVVLTPGGQILYQNAIASWLLSELEDDALEAALEAFCTPAIDVEL
ncbi:MAG: hypothetical protein D6761_12140, partial [Candidatus Dadabacteria bacterium]